MSHQSLVSVIVPTYNIGKTALKCIDSIMHQDYPNIELIVIDNGTDQTFKAAKKKYPNIKGYQSKTNLGSTGGMNAGIKLARGNYYWFIDHDNILKKDMLSQLMKVAKLDKKIAVAAPKIYYWDKKDVIWSAGTSVGKFTGFNYSREGKDRGQYDKIEEVEIAPANFLVKKEAIDKVGFYDDVYWLSYEDADWCARLRSAGYKIVYTPHAICYHKMPILNKTEGKRRWLARAYLTARNKIIFMRKNSSYFPLFVLLYPGWFLLYTFQSIKYNDLQALKNFYRGIYDGFKWSLSYTQK